MIKILQYMYTLIPSGKRTIPTCSSLANMPCFLSRSCCYGGPFALKTPPLFTPLVPIVLEKRQWPNNNMLFASSPSGPTHFVSTRGEARRSAESLCPSLTRSSAALCCCFRRGRLFEPSVSCEVRRLVGHVTVEDGRGILSYCFQ